jgi:hypothetical protein
MSNNFFSFKVSIFAGMSGMSGMKKGLSGMADAWESANGLRFGPSCQHASMPDSF